MHAPDCSKVTLPARAMYSPDDCACTCGAKNKPTKWEHRTWQFASWNAAHERLDQLAEDGWTLMSTTGHACKSDLHLLYVTCRRKRDPAEGVPF